MKKLTIAVFSFASCLCLGQISKDSANSFENNIDSIELSCLDFNGFSDMSTKQKKWMESTFLIEKGGFTVPKNPIGYPFKNE